MKRRGWKTWGKLKRTHENLDDMEQRSLKGKRGEGGGGGGRCRNRGLLLGRERRQVQKIQWERSEIWLGEGRGKVKERPWDISS